MAGRCLVWAPLLICLAGCSGAPDPFQIKTAKNGEGYSFATDEYLEPVDGGRLEIAPPKDWTRLPLDSNFLAQFYFKQRNDLPRIDVTVDPTPFEGFENVTEQNLQKFAQAVDEDLKAQKRPFIEPVKPMIIGGTPCVRYVVQFIRVTTDRRGTRLRIPAERQIIQTVRAGRLYTVDLRVLEETILRYRDAAYSVVATLKFHEVAESADEKSGFGDDDGMTGEVPRLKDSPGFSTSPR